MPLPLLPIALLGLGAAFAVSVKNAIPPADGVGPYFVIVVTEGFQAPRLGTKLSQGMDLGWVDVGETQAHYPDPAKQGDPTVLEAMARMATLPANRHAVIVNADKVVIRSR